MFRLLAWFVLAHVGRVQALQGTPGMQSELALATAGPPSLCCWSYMFALNRKAGEVILSNIGSDFGRKIGMHFSTITGGHADSCEDFPNTIGAEVKHNIGQYIASCPSTRIVYSMRRPSAMLVSEYTYLKDGDPGPGDFSYDGRGEIVATQPLSTGLQKLCQSWLLSEFAGLNYSYSYVQQRKPEQVLIVRLEDFEKDYDNTTRSIFEHFLGSGDSRIDDLVTTAKSHDLGRMPPEQVNTKRHVSSERDKAAVAAEMGKQFYAGDSCMAKVAQLDKLLGYSSL